MANNNWPTWLDTVSYPAPGVGDLQDLRFKIGVGEGGQWIGFVNTGWFYSDRLEQYRYALVGTQTVSASAGSGQATESVSFRPSWGPIILTGLASGQYTQHHNTFQPGQTVSWTLLASGVYYATIPGSTIVVGVRDLTLLPLGSVSGTGSLISEKFFYYDYPGGRLYIKPKNLSPINVFVDYLELAPRLRFRELVIQDGGVLYPSYQGIENIIISRGYQTQSLAGPVTGYITHSLSGVQDGDWVVLDYLIQKSYVVYNHQTVRYYTTAASGDTLRINYETSLPDIIPAMSLTKPRPELGNWNPLFSNALRTGYLYHANMTQPASSYWTVSKVYAFLDKDWICAQWGEMFKATVLVTDTQGLPVPYYPLTISMTSGASAIGRVPASSVGSTDGRGEVHFLVSVPTSMSLLTLNVICSAVTGTATGSVLSAATALPSSVFFGGSTEVYVSKNLTARRYWRLYAKNTCLDGIPKTQTSIVLKSEKASAFEYKTALTNQQVIIPALMGVDNLDGIAGLFISEQLGYLPQPGDRLIGYTTGTTPSQGKMWRTEDNA